MGLCTALLALFGVVGFLLLTDLARATFPGKNGLIAFVRPTGKGQGLFVVDPVKRRQYRVRRLFSAVWPVWAPNGQSLSISSFSNILSSNLYVMRVRKRRGKLVGKRAKQITPQTPNSTSTSDGDSTWHRSGKKIAFVRSLFSSSSPSKDVIAVVGRNGGKVRNLYSCINICDAPDWSANGKKIAFTDGPSGSIDIYVVNSKGGNLRKVTSNPGAESRPSWSPNGKRIVFSRDGDLYLMKSNGKSEKRLTRGKKVDSGPVWSPDGLMIAFERKRKSGAKSVIYVMSSNGRNIKRMSRGIGSQPDWQRLKK